jgi:hypothetical protein
VCASESWALDSNLKNDKIDGGNSHHDVSVLLTGLYRKKQFYTQI